MGRRSWQAGTAEPQRLPTVEGIREAATAIDHVFRATPQFVAGQLGELLGCQIIVKIETLNPLRSFKGRGPSWLFQQLGQPEGPVVTASAGNFGQGMAYCGVRRGWEVIVFAAESANPLKIDAMRRLGAEVRLAGHDFDAAKAVARTYAAEHTLPFVEDGADPAITEGAGTIGYELVDEFADLDAILVPVGNGALATGVGTWVRYASPRTRVVGVSASGAPAMAQSWRARTAVATESVATIADGIAVRVPVPEAVAGMAATVDEMLLVSDDQILQSMRLALMQLGILLEPAGAAALAACREHPETVAGKRVAVVLGGANVTDDQYRAWFC